MDSINKPPRHNQVILQGNFIRSRHALQSGFLPGRQAGVRSNDFNASTTFKITDSLTTNMPGYYKSLYF